ncbi:MAG TPA: response regulator [Anaeromyxobacter sp.]
MRTSAPIFVVDDDPDLREVLGDLLTDEGYETHLFANGQSALALLQEGARPHLILLDLMMPGMSGWQFREEQLRDVALRDIPVIVMTASTGFDASPLHAAEILKKPVGIEQILDAVERNVLRS